MDAFLDLSDKNKFQGLLDEYHLKKLRQKIYVQILRNNQNDFFDLELFNRQYVKDMLKTLSFSEILTKELELHGWKTYLGYGETALFIYDKEKPNNAW